MNGYKVVCVIIIHGMLGECLLKSLRNRKGRQRHFEILRPSKNFHGHQVVNQKKRGDIIKSRLGFPNRNKPGKSHANIKSTEEANLLRKDQIYEANDDVSKLPYIVLPPNNVLPDDEKKVRNLSKHGNSNAITKQHIPATAIPIVVTAIPLSTIQTSTEKPTAPITTTHSTRHPTPQPVHINLVLPTARPVVQASPSQQHAQESNETKIDLSLNVGEEHQKEKPVVIQLPQTMPSFVDAVLAQIQKAQEIKSQLLLLGNTQRAFQGPYIWKSPSPVTPMFGLPNPYNAVSIAEEVSSQSTNPYGYPLGILPQNILPFQGLKNNPLVGLPYMNQWVPLSPIASLLSNAIKSSLGQSQPEMITSALNQAALQVQAQKQPPQMVMSALTQAIAKIVNNEPSEEQKLTDILAAALNLAKARESEKRFIPTTSSLKLEIANPTNPPLNLVNHVMKQGQVAAPAEQIISVNVSPVIPQQNPISAPSLLQSNPANLPPAIQNPINAPSLHQSNAANLPPVIPQQNPINAPSFSQSNPVSPPPVMPQQNPINAPSFSQSNVANLPPVIPQQNPINAPSLHQSNAANLPPVILQQNPINAPSLLQSNAANLPPVMSQQNPINAPSLPQSNPVVNLPPVIPKPCPANVVHLSQPSKASLSPVIAQPSLGNTSPLPQLNPVNIPAVLPQPCPTNSPLLTQPNSVNLKVVSPQPYPSNTLPLPQPFSSSLRSQNSPANAPSSPQPVAYTSLDHITVSALGKAMAKALVHTAKKIVHYNKSAVQRDTIISSNSFSNNRHFGWTAFFNPNKTRKLYYRTSSGFPGLKSFQIFQAGPIKKKYLRQRCCCCCCCWL